jgi:hypothetical protein
MPRVRALASFGLALVGFVLAPLTLVLGLLSLDFSRRLPVEPYQDGVTAVYLDRPYRNETPDPGFAGLRIVRLPRHLRFDVALELSEPARVLRLLSDEHDNAPFADWEPVPALVRVPGRSCVLTRAVAKELLPGLHPLPPGGPVAAAPLLVASAGEVAATTTSTWNKLTPGNGALELVLRNKRKLATLALLYVGWCVALARLFERRS